LSQFSFDDFKKIVSEQLGLAPAKIEPQSKLIEDLGADSIAMVNIVAEVEVLIDKDLEDLDFDDVVTMQDAYDTLRNA